MKHQSTNRSAQSARLIKLPVKQSLVRWQHKDRRGERSKVLPDVNLTKLAVEAGLNRSQLSRLVNGHGKQTGLDVLSRLGKVLGFETVEQVDRWLKSLKAE